MNRVVQVLSILFLAGLIGRSAFAAAAVPDGYKLQPGDLLQVVVWKETDLQSEVLIRPDGGISFALAGDMQAAGLTTDQRGPGYARIVNNAIDIGAYQIQSAPTMQLVFTQ